MDFRKCPHCSASIIDDEATDCPSCGLSLSGSPSAASPAATAAAPVERPKAKPAPPAAKKPADPKKPARVGETTDPDDPFDIGVDETAAKAIPVAPKPSKNRTTRVVCPMCEAPGFIPEPALGRDVKCWKKTCQMPVFKAPMPEREPEPEPEPKSKGGLLKALAAVVLIAALGGGYWFITQPPPEVAPIDMPIAGGGGDTDNPNPDGPDGSKPPGFIDPSTVAVKGPEFLPFSEIQAKALTDVVSEAKSPRTGNKQAAIRRAAEALALNGEFDKARQRLAGISSRNPYIRIGPLNTIALETLKSGDVATAKSAADEATKYAGQLPNSGREPLDWATGLAEVLVRLDRVDEAKRLIKDKSSSQRRGELSALWSGAEDLGTYNIAATRRSSLVSGSDNPQWLAVTRALVADGATELGRQWANEGPGAVRGDALTVWAATLSRTEGKVAARDAILAFDSAEPALKARMMAAAGLARIEKSDEQARDTTVAVEAAEEAVASEPATADPPPTSDGEAPSVEEIARDADELKAESAKAVEVATTDADSLLGRAVAALQQSEVSTEAFETPSTTEFYESDRKPNEGLPDAAPIRTQALANLKIAELQHALGNDEAAWEAVKAGVLAARAMAPSPVEMRRLADEYRSRSKENAIVRTLQSGLGMDASTARNRAFVKYRRQVDAYLEAAERRLDLQERLLASALDWKLDDRVKAFIAESREVEPWATTSIAKRLGLPTQDGPDGRPPVLPDDIRIGQKVDEFVEAKQTDKLLAYLARSVRDEDRELWSAIAAARWLEAGERRAFIEFVNDINSDDNLVEDLLQRGAAQAATAGIGPQLWKDLNDKDIAEWDDNERVAYLRGFAGIKPAQTVGATVAEK